MPKLDQATRKEIEYRTAQGETPPQIAFALKIPEKSINAYRGYLRRFSAGQQPDQQEEVPPLAIEKSPSAAAGDLVDKGVESLERGIDVIERIKGEGQSKPHEMVDATTRAIAEGAKLGGSRNGDGAGLLPLLMAFFQQTMTVMNAQHTQALERQEKDSVARQKELEDKHNNERQRDRDFFSELAKLDGERRSFFAEKMKYSTDHLDTLVANTEKLVRAKEEAADKIADLKQIHADKIATLTKQEESGSDIKAVADMILKRVAEPIVQVIEKKQNLAPAAAAASTPALPAGAQTETRAEVGIMGDLLGGLSGTVLKRMAPQIQKIADEAVRYIEKDLPVEMLLRTLLTLTRDEDFGGKAQVAVTYIAGHDLKEFLALAGEYFSDRAKTIFASPKAAKLWQALQKGIINAYKEAEGEK